MHRTVSELTLEEKATLLTGAGFWSSAAVERVGVEAAVLTDGPHGVRLQRTSSDNLGIFDSEPATAFPPAATTGSTWDPQLLEALGVALGKEARALGIDVLLGPGVNIKRSPLCGRNFEYFSEDPLLSGALGAAWVRGLQSQGVGASVKHFAANNQETDRMRVSADVDERSLREIYFPAFEHIVRSAAPATVMCSYNRLNGVYASENYWLLTEVLRDEWGFDGYVMSDWGAVHTPVDAVAAGLDLTMPAAGDRHVRAVVDAVEAGTLPIETVDRAVSRILSVHDRLRALQGEAVVDIDAHHELARRLASAGSVLLTNDGALPLSPTEGGAIALVGEFARTPRYQGAGSSHINPHRVDTALEAITGCTEREVRFAPGFRLDGSSDEALIGEAIDAVRDAGSIVLFLGLPDREESEGFDREHLDLPRVQLELLDRLLALRSDVVVVLSNGSVVDLSPMAGRVAAILETWLGGQASGSAVADVLFGRVEPGGRLAETIPLHLTDTPSFVNFPGSAERVLYGERIYVGYRWYDSTRRDVAFPFGFGLGYTSWSIDDVDVAVPDPAVARATVAFTVTNSGQRAGSQVVQVYVGDPVASADRPTRELKAFARVELDAGESRRVHLELNERAFAFWAPEGWTVEPGQFVVEVGTSSRDIVATRVIDLDVPLPTPTLQPDSTLAEWLGHPVGNPVLSGALEQSGAGTLQFLEDDTARRMMEQMPLRVIFGFGGSTDGAAAVGDLLRAVEHASG